MQRTRWPMMAVVERTRGREVVGTPAYFLRLGQAMGRIRRGCSGTSIFPRDSPVSECSGWTICGPLPHPPSSSPPPPSTTPTTTTTAVIVWHVDRRPKAVEGRLRRPPHMFLPLLRPPLLRPLPLFLLVWRLLHPHLPLSYRHLYWMCGTGGKVWRCGVAVRLCSVPRCTTLSRRPSRTTVKTMVVVLHKRRRKRRRKEAWCSGGARWCSPVSLLPPSSFSRLSRWSIGQGRWTPTIGMVEEKKGVTLLLLILYWTRWTPVVDVFLSRLSLLRRSLAIRARVFTSIVFCSP